MKKYIDFNPIQDEPFQGCSWIVGWPKSTLPLPKVSHISYKGEIWHSYTLPKKDQKNI